MKRFDFEFIYICASLCFTRRVTSLDAPVHSVLNFSHRRGNFPPNTGAFNAPGRALTPPTPHPPSLSISLSLLAALTHQNASADSDSDLKSVGSAPSEGWRCGRGRWTRPLPSSRRLSEPFDLRDASCRLLENLQPVTAVFFTFMFINSFIWCSDFLKLRVKASEELSGDILSMFISTQVCDNK